MKRVYAAVLVVLLALPALQCATSGINKGQINLISCEEEKKLGKQFARDIEKEIQLLDDAPTIAFVTAVGKKILGSADEVKFSYIFKVVDTDDVNAFAVPGGRVYVNRGLIMSADNESQLGAVIAHEIAHVVGRHGTERLTVHYGIDFLGQAILGQKPKEWQSLIANVAAGAGLLAYSRDQEREADKLGLTYLYKSGWDPNGMPEFFKKLRALSNEPDDKISKTILKYLSTHPPTDERVSAANKRIAKMQLRADLVKDTEKFRQIKERLATGKREPKAAKSERKKKKKE